MLLRWMLLMGLVLGFALVGCPGGDDDDSGAGDDDATSDDDDATADDDDDATPGDDDDATPGDDDDATPGDDDDSGADDDDDSAGDDDDDSAGDDDDDDSAGAQCLSGGSVINPPGAGTCATRYVINLANLPFGTVVTHEAGAAGADEADFNAPGYCAAPPVGTARDIVYHVRGPAGTQAIEICVEPAAGGDPRIAVLEDPDCGQPANLCIDDQPAGTPEFLHADRGAVFYSDDTYVVVSEMVHSGADFTVSFTALQ